MQSFPVRAGTILSAARRRPRLLALLMSVLLMLPLVLAAAPANAGTYTYYGAESYNSTGATAFVQFNAAHSYSLISIQSNYVHCPAYNGAHVTWCGTVGNNTNHAQGGVNYTVNGVSYWMREDVYAATWYGSLKCYARGNATTHFVTYCNGVGN
jgi:hypothetical protein